MKIYQTHKITGEFLFETDADANPLEVGSFLIPAGAVNIAPPETGENEVAVWNDGWSVQPDFRGQQVWKEDEYDNELRTEIGEIGEIQDGYFLSKPDIPEEILLKREQAEEFKNKRAFMKNAWVSLEYAYIRGPFQSTFDSANSLLDNGDIDGAIALIEYSEPLAGYDETQQVVFNQIKEQFIYLINNLK